MGQSHSHSQITLALGANISSPHSQQQNEDVKVEETNSRLTPSSQGMNHPLNFSTSSFPSFESEDSEFEVVLSPQEQKIASAEICFKRGDYLEAAKLIEGAIAILKQSEVKNEAYWKLLADYRELHASAYENAHRVTLDSHLRASSLLQEEKNAKEELYKQNEQLKETAKTAMATVVEHFRRERERLNSQIQRLESNANPSLMEYISNGLVSVFNSIRQCNLHYQLYMSIHAFWTNLTTTQPDNQNEPSSPTELDRLKAV
jgi:hypothetical protein